MTDDKVPTRNTFGDVTVYFFASVTD